MQELSMINVISGHTVEGAISLLNDLKWSISIVEDNGTWSVGAGHKLVLKTSSREAVDSLLYGMALAYSVLPETILDQFKRYGEDATS